MSQHLSGRTENKYKTLSIAGVSAEIESGQLPNASPECHSWIRLAAFEINSGTGGKKRYCDKVGSVV
jgi:hypothetical protein